MLTRCIEEFDLEEGQIYMCVDSQSSRFINGRVYTIGVNPSGDLGIIDESNLPNVCTYSKFKHMRNIITEPVYPNPPRLHRESIIAWANGADIEHYHDGLWYLLPNPSWGEDSQYRIKKSEKELLLDEIAVLQKRYRELDK